MKRIPKIVAIAVLVAALGYGVASFLVGMKAETFYRQALVQFSRSDKLSLICLRYERGYFHSEAETLVTVSDGPAGMGEVRKFTLKHSIQHGPLAFIDRAYTGRRLAPVQAVIETRIVTGPEMQEELNKLYEEVPELRSTESLTVVCLTGAGDAWLYIPSFKMQRQGESPLFVKWDGLTAHLTFAEGLKEIDGTVSAPGWEMKSASEEIKVRPAAIQLNAREEANGIVSGDFGLTLAGFDFKPIQDSTQAEPAQEVHGDSFAMKFSSGMAGDSVKAWYIASFEKVAVGVHSYGPFRFEFELRKLDAAALAKFGKDMREIQERTAQMGSEEVEGRLLAKYIELASGLLAGSPEVEIKQLSLTTDRGDVTGKAMLAFGKTSTKVFENPLSLLNTISASADLSVAESLLTEALESYFADELRKEAEESDEELPASLAKEMTANQINALVSQNFLVKEGAVYKSSATYKAGRINVNGRGISIAELLQE